MIRPIAVLGDIENIIVRGLPEHLGVEVDYVGADIMLTFIACPALQAPTKSSQSPGVDIDRIHAKYPPKEQQP